MNTWKLCKKNRLIQLIEMMSIVDDVEENPIIANDGLKQQQEQVTSELPTET